MKDIIKKSVLLGIGISVLTKEKAQKFVNSLMKKGQMTAKEKQKLVNELMNEAKKAQNEGMRLVGDLKKEYKKTGARVTKVVDKHLSRALKNMPATRRELAKLKKTLKKVKRKKRKR